MKRLACILLLGVGSLFWTGGDSSVNAQQLVGWAGAGMASCAKFANLSQQDPTMNELIFTAWAQGFMSGLNVAVMNDPRKETNLMGRDIEGQERFLRQFCATHPKKRYVEGVLRLWNDMRGEQRLPAYP